MRFSDDALDELREIYREEFQEEITRDQAAEIGARLVTLIRLVIRPLPPNQEPIQTPPF